VAPGALGEGYMGFLYYLYNFIPGLGRIAGLRSAYLKKKKKKKKVFKNHILK
jgi:hypothetical protein